MEKEVHYLIDNSPTYVPIPSQIIPVLSSLVGIIEDSR
jgi:hypothetical protein